MCFTLSKCLCMCGFLFCLCVFSYKSHCHLFVCLNMCVAFELLDDFFGGGDFCDLDLDLAPNSMKYTRS